MKLPSETFTWIHLLWIFIPLIFAVYIWNNYFNLREQFATSSIESQKIIDLYLKVLGRNPTNTELIKHSIDIDDKKYDLNELKLRLYNNDEYGRNIRTQQNILTPEITRITQEKELIEFVKEIYYYQFKKNPKVDLLLPLKDLFIHFDYDAYKLLALFRDKKYKSFEKYILTIMGLQRETLIKIYENTFNDEQLNKVAEIIRKKEKLPKLTKDTSEGAIIIKEKRGRLSDEELRRLSKYLEEKGLCARGKGMNDSLSCLNYTSKDNKSQRIYLHPKYKRAVPPVCVPVGGAQKVNPVVFGDTVGTSLDEAKNTAVGSILPKFEYNEYVELPKKCFSGVPASTPKSVSK